MAQRRFHYDQAFEQYLRRRAVPYVAVDEAKRALQRDGDYSCGVDAGPGDTVALKSFDFVVYSESGPNLLVDVKGRKHAGRSNKSLDNWVTRADVDAMDRWEGVFGEDFEAAFAFLYWCQQPPPDALFRDVFEWAGRWYAVMAIKLADYRQHIRMRSPSWGTVSVPAAVFNRGAVPLAWLL